MPRKELNAILENILKYHSVNSCITRQIHYLTKPNIIFLLLYLVPLELLLEIAFF